MKPLPTATAILRDQPEDVSFETDFSGLVARFSAMSGGGLTPELSADLALEIVLNEIVEQACRLTGATGAAIVLEREGEMVCRASSGATAPELGSRIQSGLAEQCLNTRRTQSCDDTRLDPRADLEASERLGVRSVVVMPLLRGEELVGVFELLSTQPFAFGVRDERALEVLADRTLNNLEQASRKAEPEQQEWRRETQPPSVGVRQEALALAQHAEPAPEVPAQETHRAASRGADVVVWLLGAAVVAAAVLLGIAVGRHLTWSRSGSAKRPARVAAVKEAPAVAQPEQAHSVPKPADSSAKPSSVQPGNGANPPGGLIVLDRGREVFRLPPTDHPMRESEGRGGVQLAAETEAEPETESVLQVPAEAAERNLLRRVEPRYPDAARRQKIQGEVVLEVHIAADGDVQDVQVIRGPALLARASADAVKQWKFKPTLVNGHAAEMQTRISLNFKLPE